MILDDVWNGCHQILMFKGISSGFFHIRESTGSCSTRTCTVAGAAASKTLGALAAAGVFFKLLALFKGILWEYDGDKASIVINSHKIIQIDDCASESETHWSLAGCISAMGADCTETRNSQTVLRTSTMMKLLLWSTVIQWYVWILGWVSSCLKPYFAAVFPWRTSLGQAAGIMSGCSPFCVTWTRSGNPEMEAGTVTTFEGHLW